MERVSNQIRKPPVCAKSSSALFRSKSVLLESAPPQTSIPLHRTRIGTVLISAAVIDDVLGLVLASLIPALSVIENGGDQSQPPLAWTIIRPLLSSGLMALITPVVARFFLRPIFRFRNFGQSWCAPRRSGERWGLSAMQRSGATRHDVKNSKPPRRWGTRSHADSAQLTIVVLTVSAFSTIAFCEFEVKEGMTEQSLTPDSRFRKQCSLRGVSCRTYTLIHYAVAPKQLCD